MQRIIIVIILGVIALVAFQLYSSSPSFAHSNEELVLPKQASLSNNEPPPPPKKKVQKNYKDDPELLWASDNVKYWMYDEATINYRNWDSIWSPNFNEIRQFTSFEEPFQLELFAYPNVERKALRTHNMCAAHCSEKEVHLVSNSNFEGESWGEQYRPLVHAALGEPKFKALETGLSMQWCDDIRGQTVGHWVSLLAQAKALPNLSTLYDNNSFEALPPIAAKLMATSWVDYCIKQKGKDWFLEHYTSPAPSILTLTLWNSEWQEWILATAALSISNIPAHNTDRLNGFTLAHEGYRIYNGYGGQSAKHSLEHLASIGTNAIAIVPYSFMRSAKKATPIPVSDRAGSENDQSVLFSHFSAKALGQFTLLKPQIWLNGSWPGDIDFDDDQSWQQFFTYYRTWIMHYALLAEMNDFDGFCIGTEFRHVTLKHPEFWKALIKDIRKIYHGSLTYAANWGEECEKITFWADLDFIGVNCYYPLHKKDNATKADLQAGAKKNLAKIKRIHDKYKRNVWFTEVGFRSATTPWTSPHEEAGTRLVDDEAQALCYDILLNELEQNEWVTGIFWWKWPADLTHNEDHGRGYMPFGKETENVVRRYYMEGN